MPLLMLILEVFNTSVPLMVLLLVPYYIRSIFLGTISSSSFGFDICADVVSPFIQHVRSRIGSSIGSFSHFDSFLLNLLISVLMQALM